MERNVMGELNVYRGSGAKPNFSEIARRHGMDRHTVAKYWREGESAADGRSARGSAATAVAMYHVACEMLEECCPRAARAMEEAEADALAYLDFPPSQVVSRKLV